MTTKIKEHQVSHKMQNRIANVMISGVLISIAIMFLSLIIYLFHHHGLAPNRHIFTGEPRHLESIYYIIRDSFLGLHIRSILQLGVLILLINPVIRVLMIAIGFTSEKNTLYAVISTMVLAVLLFSFLY